MKILSCKTNRIVNPLGFSLGAPVLSWVADSDASRAQAAARVVVAKDPSMETVVWDSGLCAGSGDSEGLSSLGVEVPAALTPRCRYYWTVTVKGSAGDEATSAPAWFETGKMDEPWQGRWITPPWKPEIGDAIPHPLFRKGFSLKAPVAAARIYASGVGVYALTLNGKPVSSEILAPGCTAYDSWLQVQTYDVGGLLQPGANAIGAMLGNGWAKGPFGTFGPQNTPYTDHFGLLLELHVTYADGSTEVVATDDSWKCAPSPVLMSSIYNGELYDANKEIAGWDSPACNDSAAPWQAVQLWDGKADAANVERLSAPALGKTGDRLSLPIKVMQTFAPKELLHTPAGEWVLDIGQNISGWLRIKLHEKAGTQVSYSCGETLQDDNFYRENLRGAQAKFTYITDGKERTVEPHFTWMGFRYAKLEGFSEPINIEDFSVCAICGIALDAEACMHTPSTPLDAKF
jgi:alpha-L-rhamnosidase